MRIIGRLLPVLIPMSVLAFAWLSGALDQVSWAGLAENKTALAELVTTYPLLAPGLYVLTYALLAAISFPIGGVLTVTGGLLFGPIWGGILAVVGASAGAIALFLAARSALAEPLARLGGPVVQATQARLRRDGFLYLLALRLLPLAPFWLVNLAGALSGMRLFHFALATVIGIVPLTFVFASIGAGVGEVLAVGGRPDLSVIFAPRILLPLIGLAVLSLLPLFLRKRITTDG